MATLLSTYLDLPTPVQCVLVFVLGIVTLAPVLVRCYLMIRAGRVALNPADPESPERAQRVLELSMRRPRSFRGRK
ncbi:hypothetical protein GS504_02560 [Rhodococcus hoagii]|nr:hypothetical protein [Prescottella equi]NKS56471.1 hypothetical protein [Prescottella equi]NKS64787.1 hypothetical protein [Prescottella equi]NKS64794.1 hypothetical protein [Prescottella equi]NKS71500.1 hypothetical protein [Prescottella equi]